MKACSVLGVGQAFTCYNNPKGNADTERMMRTLKEELLWLQEWHDPYEVSGALADWIGRYNESYLHSTLGYKTPNAMEETYNLTTRTLLEIAC
jgi:transposase InsO family protein